MMQTDPFIAIRQAIVSDAPRIQEIESHAAELFRQVGMPEIADSPTLSQKKILRGIAEGFFLVAEASAEAQSRVVGFLYWRPLEGYLFVEELSVDPLWHGHRIGGRLLEAVQEFSRHGHGKAVVLTTFAEVPWNGPYYRRLGFQNWSSEEAPTSFRERLEQERLLFRAARCLMKK